MFLYEGICSSDTLDSYDTRMDPTTTLRDFSDNLLLETTLETTLMEGYSTERNPYRGSFDAEILEKEGVTSVSGR